jgi:hypothetical protein
MDQLQFGAFIEQLTRIANALEAAKPAEPDAITLPIGAYKTFDWTQINCRVFADDDFGVSQVFCMNDGRVYTRRTNDKFGSEIWFSRGDGKAADGTARYKRLIEFREIKDAEPIGRKAEQALKHAPNVQAPELKAPALNAPRIELPADLRKDWLYWHDEASKFGAVPAELGIYEADTISSVKDKIARLTALVEAGAVADAQILLDKLVMALADAKEAGVDVPAEFYATAGVPADVIEMRIGTVKNLIAAQQGAQVMTQSATQSAPAQQPIANVAAQQVINDLRDAAGKSAQRVTTQSQDFDIISALEHVCGTEKARQRFTEIVFGEARFDKLKPAQRCALLTWLRPARVASGKAQPTNPKAAAGVAAVLTMPQAAESPEQAVTA